MEYYIIYNKQFKACFCTVYQVGLKKLYNKSHKIIIPSLVDFYQNILLLVENGHDSIMSNINYIKIWYLIV